MKFKIFTCYTGAVWDRVGVITVEKQWFGYLNENHHQLFDDSPSIFY